MIRCCRGRLLGTIRGSALGGRAAIHMQDDDDDEQGAWSPGSRGDEVAGLVHSGHCQAAYCLHVARRCYSDSVDAHGSLLTSKS